MKLLLQRDVLSEDATAGLLYDVTNPDEEPKFECFTLEDKMREVPGRPVAEWKVKGKTAIPVGKYKVIIAPSPKRNGRLMPLLLNVPGFIGIQIHSGNTVEDTEGCILVGILREGANVVRGSRTAFEKLYAKLLICDSSHEEVTIEVRNPA